MKVNWKKLWKELDIWTDLQEGSGQDSYYLKPESQRQFFFPEWPAQARKINHLVNRQILIQEDQFPLIRVSGRLNWRRIWKELNKCHENCRSAGPDWSIQKQWIRELITKEIQNSIRHVT